MFRLMACMALVAITHPPLALGAMGIADDQRFSDAGVASLSVAAPAVASMVSSTTARETRAMDASASSQSSTSGSRDAPTEPPLFTREPSSATFAPVIPAPTTFTLTPEASTTRAPTFSVTPTLAPVIDFSSSSTGSGSGGGGDDVVFPPASVMPPADSSFSGSGFGSSSTAGHGDHNVGEGSDGDAGVAPYPTTPAMPTAAPVSTAAPVPPATPVPTSLTPEASEEAARAANSRVARDISGENGGSVVALASGVGGIGCVAVIVIAVYMRRRNESDLTETRTVASSSIDRRGSVQSVYDDPLGTRFSSIVMITPNGDGVCIL